MLLKLVEGWNAELNQGPNWLVVRLSNATSPSASSAPLADALWTVMRQQFTQRLVIDLDQIPLVESYMISELLRLQTRIRSEGGLLRLCGVSEQIQNALRVSKLGGQLPQYQTPVDAMKGFRPAKPR